MTRRTDHRVPSLVRGRDGTLVAFDSARISTAVMRATRELDIDDEALSARFERLSTETAASPVRCSAFFCPPINRSSRRWQVADVFAGGCTAHAGEF